MTHNANWIDTEWRTAMRINKIQSKSSIDFSGSVMAKSAFQNASHSSGYSNEGVDSYTVAIAQNSCPTEFAASHAIPSG